jgi:hypothetical protein
MDNTNPGRQIRTSGNRPSQLQPELLKELIRKTEGALIG